MWPVELNNWDEISAGRRFTTRPNTAGQRLHLVLCESLVLSYRYSHLLAFLSASFSRVYSGVLLALTSSRSSRLNDLGPRNVAGSPRLRVWDLLKWPTSVRKALFVLSGSYPSSYETPPTQRVFCHIIYTHLALADHIAGSQRCFPKRLARGRFG